MQLANINFISTGANFECIHAMVSMIKVNHYILPEGNLINSIISLNCELISCRTDGRIVIISGDRYELCPLFKCGHNYAMACVLRLTVYDYINCLGCGKLTQYTICTCCVTKINKVTSNLLKQYIIAKSLLIDDIAKIICKLWLDCRFYIPII